MTALHCGQTGSPTSCGPMLLHRAVSVVSCPQGSASNLKSLQRLTVESVIKFLFLDVEAHILVKVMHKKLFNVGAELK